MGIQFIYPLISDKKLNTFKYPRETIYKKPKEKHLKMFRKHHFDLEKMEFHNISNYNESLKDKIFTLFRCPNCLSIIDIFFDPSLKKNFIYFDCYCGNVKVEINEFMYYYLSNPIKEVYCQYHKEKKAVCYFKNIFQFICDDCYKYYNKMNEEKEKKEHLLFYSLNKVFLYCREHNLNFYSFCFTCGKNYCLKCTEHQNHYTKTFKYYIKLKNISYNNIYHLLNSCIQIQETYQKYLNIYKKVLNERELNELISYMNKNYFTNCQLYYLGELINFIYEYNRNNLCFQFICNMHHLEKKNPSTYLLNDLKKTNKKTIIINAFKKVMNILLISSNYNKDLKNYYINFPSENPSFYLKTKFDIMNSNLYISLDNGQIYYYEKSSKQILYFDNDYPFVDEKPKKLFDYEYDYIKCFFEIKKLKLLGIAFFNFFLLYDYEKKKIFQQININVRNDNDKIYSIIELSNLMIAVNINKKNINFFKFNNEKKEYYYIDEPLKKIKEKITLNDFEIYSGSDIFMIIESIYIYFFRFTNDNFILKVKLKTISRPYLPKNININTNEILFVTISKNNQNIITGFYLYSYCLKTLQTITSTFQKWEYNNFNETCFGISNNNKLLYYTSESYLFLMNKLTFEYIEFLLFSLIGKINNIVETKNHHFLFYYSENKTGFIHHNQYKNIYNK